MRTISKWAILFFILLTILGHPRVTKEVGWDYCTEEGHPFTLIVFKFGWPIPGIIVNQIWGCLTIPNQWVEYSLPGVIGTAIFWNVVFWILEVYWPTDDCFEREIATL